MWHARFVDWTLIIYVIFKYGIAGCYNEIPDTMYGGALPVARKRKPKRRTTSKADDLEEASEPK